MVMIHEMLQAALAALAIGDVLHLHDEVPGLVVVAADERDMQSDPDVVASRVPITSFDVSDFTGFV